MQRNHIELQKQFYVIYIIIFENNKTQYEVFFLLLFKRCIRSITLDRAGEGLLSLNEIKIMQPNNQCQQILLFF